MLLYALDRNFKEGMDAHHKLDDLKNGFTHFVADKVDYDTDTLDVNVLSMG